MRFTMLLVPTISALMIGSASADNSFFTDEGFELYDDFSERTINPDLWLGSQVGVELFQFPVDDVEIVQRISPAEPADVQEMDQDGSA